MTVRKTPMNIKLHTGECRLEGVVSWAGFWELFAVASALALATGVAQAATELAFTITGAGHTLIFDLPQILTPDTFTHSANLLGLMTFSGTEDGSPGRV